MTTSHAPRSGSGDRAARIAVVTAIGVAAIVLAGCGRLADRADGDGAGRLGVATAAPVEPSAASRPSPSVEPSAGASADPSISAGPGSGSAWGSGGGPSGPVVTMPPPLDLAAIEQLLDDIDDALADDADAPSQEGSTE